MWFAVGFDDVLRYRISSDSSNVELDTSFLAASWLIIPMGEGLFFSIPHQGYGDKYWQGTITGDTEGSGTQAYKFIFSIRDQYGQDFGDYSWKTYVCLAPINVQPIGDKRVKWCQDNFSEGQDTFF